MKFWSKGLGLRSHLNIAVGTEIPKYENQFIVLYGTTLPPVVWNYTMTMGVNDFLSILKVGFTKTFLSFLLSPKRVFSALKLLFYIFLILVKFPFVSRLIIEQKTDTEAVN